MILLSLVRFIPWYDIGDIMTVATYGAGNAYPSGAPNFTSGFHSSSCCPVIYVSLFHVIVLSFVFWVLIVPFVWFLGIYIFYFKTIQNIVLCLHFTFLSWFMVKNITIIFKTSHNFSLTYSMMLNINTGKTILLWTIICQYFIEFQGNMCNNNIFFVFVETWHPWLVIVILSIQAIRWTWKHVTSKIILYNCIDLYKIIEMRKYIKGKQKMSLKSFGIKRFFKDNLRLEMWSQWLGEFKIRDVS